MGQKRFSPILVVLLVVIAILAFVVFFFSRNKQQYVPKNISELNCVSAITVQGNSMEPAIKSGSLLSLNKCLDMDGIATNKIVLYKDGRVQKIGRVKERLEKEDEVYYLITRDNRPNEESTIPSTNILASE